MQIPVARLRRKTHVTPSFSTRTMPALIRSTTVLGLTHKGKTVIGSDGQVTVGQTVMKHQASKVRRTLQRRRSLPGFAGAAADAFTLFGEVRG